MGRRERRDENLQATGAVDEVLQAGDSKAAFSSSLFTTLTTAQMKASCVFLTTGASKVRSSWSVDESFLKFDFFAKAFFACEKVCQINVHLQTKVLL